MSILNDKTFEGMDWLSQAVEPYHCQLNDVLALMPNEYELTPQEVFGAIVASYRHHVDLSNVVGSLYQNIAKTKEVPQLGYDEREILTDCFKFETSPEVTVDAASTKMNGAIKLIKVKNIIDEKDVKRLMARSAHLRVRSTDCHTETLHDVGAILLEGTDLHKEFLDAKSNKSRFHVISRFVNQSVEKDSFKIRSVEAYRKFIDIISGFLESKDPKKLGEIYRVMLMAKRGQVVYSVEA